MARIVYITSRFPYPYSKGDQLRSYFQIEYLSRNHELHLIALHDCDISAKQREALSFCASITVFPISRFKRIKSLFRSLFSKTPFQVAWFLDSKVKKLVMNRIDHIDPDYVHCHLIRCAEYLADINCTSKSLDFMDAFSLGLKKRKSIERNKIKRWIMNLETKRLVEYEQKMTTLFDHFCIISDQDKQAINLNKPVSVVPNGVDNVVFYPKNIEKRFDLCFMGNISYPPNTAAVKFLVEEIFPKLLEIRPNTTLLIAGANPPKCIQNYASQNISVIAHFDDISDALAQSRILISPLIISIGLANKIIQAMAMKIPNIVSPNANEAIGSMDGEELLVAQRPKDYVENVIRLLEDAALYERIIESAYSFVNEKYEWDLVNRQLENMILGNSTQ